MARQTVAQAGRSPVRGKPGARPTPKSSLQSGKGKGKVISEAPKSRRRASTSSSSEDGGAGEDNDQSVMLAALQAHSRALLGLDGPDEAESSTAAQKRSASSPHDENEDEDDEAEECQSDDGWGAEDDFVTDSEDDQEGVAVAAMSSSGASASASGTRVPEVVFAQQSRSSTDVLSKAERKAFLMGNSAKMMGIKRETDYPAGNVRKRPRDEAEEADDHSKLKLDKTLHDMLLTNLLPAASADTASRPVEKRNAMHGRLLELASYALPGEGGKTATTSNSKLSAHPAKIRTGIVKAQAKRDEKARMEAKMSGSTGLGDNPDSKKGREKRDRAVMGADLGKKKGMESRKKGDAARDRGLGMGIGKFDRGMLKLSAGEIARASGERRGGGGGRKRGGGWGRGGGRGGGKR